jgi:hypothetical protein
LATSVGFAASGLGWLNGPIRAEDKNEHYLSITFMLRLGNLNDRPRLATRANGAGRLPTLVKPIAQPAKNPPKQQLYSRRLAPPFIICSKRTYGGVELASLPNVSRPNGLCNGQ